MKLKKGIVSEVKKSREFQENQETLRAKYKIDKKFIVVEKNNMMKFTVKTGAALIRTAATVIILILAAIGLTTLLYPELRTALQGILSGLFQQMKL